MDGFIPGQIFTTSASLVDSVDKKLLVVLRDGRKLIGVLRSFDQFANLVLQDTVERIYVGDAYGDIPRGIFIIRGENVVLLGEIDLDKEDILPLREKPIDEILAEQREEIEDRQKRDKLKNKMLHDRGFSVDFTETDLVKILGRENNREAERKHMSAISTAWIAAIVTALPVLLIDNSYNVGIFLR
ncbi:2905_t:CDS:2 [Paraglomus brasilianum]|uniref:U6 snRNA-associated Sm-like protein LSm1 n=1 Tax=Paraglomus brasilianum TaxID=144538 RepID=A0A9N8VVM3_9GLOM|nr:2905_t:CDS:2 [Paraglomus brasilianum]